MTFRSRIINNPKTINKMASKKSLKKDINYLVDEVVGTCLMHQSLQKEKNDQEFENIIENIIIFREEMIEKANNPELTEDCKSLRLYYRNLKEEIINHVNQVFENLSNTKE